MKMFNILVFPCGSEIGLEIHRSLKYSAHINLFGASSIDDHGKFVYEKYIGGLPFIDSVEIIPRLKNLVNQYKLDAIYPAMDSVICKLKNHELKLGCKIISSNAETTEICLSKSSTYNLLKDIVKTPKVYQTTKEVENYPIFIKPDVGYGTRGTYKAMSLKEADFFLNQKDNKHILSEYLPGSEYTIDCFTNRKGQLLFVGPRKRNRVMNGISVNTSPANEQLTIFHDFTEAINKRLHLRGAWFFQVKMDKNGRLTLLEVASRLGGSSSLYRGLGVNFALLSVFDAFDIDVEIMTNKYEIEMDRALSNRYRTNLDYSSVYVDFDDCLVIRDRINSELIAFLYRALSNGTKIVLLTKHEGNLNAAMQKHRIAMLFDEVIQIRKDEQKYTFIKDKSGIFIDDSFAERKEIAARLGLPTFSPDMIELL